VGGGNFFGDPPSRATAWQAKSCVFLLARARALARLLPEQAERPTLNIPTLDVQITSLWADVMAARVHTHRVDSRDYGLHHFFAR